MTEGSPLVYLTYEASATHDAWTACVDNTTGTPEYDGSGPDPLSAVMALAQVLYAEVRDIRPFVDQYRTLELKYIKLRDEHAECTKGDGGQHAPA